LKTNSVVLALLFFCCAGKGFSQALTVSTPQLIFGTVFENAPDSMQLTINNTLNRVVNVNGIEFYNTYGVPAFSASEQNFSIAPASSYSVWIRFSPRHNIFHNSEMVIVNDGLRGYECVDLKGQGAYSNAYYNSSENFSEEALKTALTNLTGIGYTSLGYNIARDSMFMFLDNKKLNGQGAAQNTLECIYTGREAIGYTDRSDCQSNHSFNTEHTFPQSYFNSLEPMKSDLHHLFPTDDLANNYRGDNPYGIVTGATIWAVGGSKATSSLFEPRDAQKGAAARALMYFVLRYQNYNGFFTSQEAILRTWHRDFPVGIIDKKRNDDISLIQHNRNPFIDYPQFIERITSITSTSVAPVVKSLDFLQDTIIYGYVQQGIPSVFHFVFVNDGNTTVQLSGFSLSHPALSFQSGGSGGSLAPGEAWDVYIQLITADNDPLQAFLEFNTDDPLHLSVSVPIYANDSVFDFVNEPMEAAISIFPVPAANELNITGKWTGMHTITAYDVPGRWVLELESQGPMRHTLDVSPLPPGIYVVKIKCGEKNFFRKFLKE
jgi:hypothetical protein